MNHSRTDFWPILEAKALALGFADLATSSVGPLTTEAKALEDWLDKGYAGEMEYMGRTKKVRQDPQLFLPGARSVLVGTVGYYPAKQDKESPAALKQERESSSGDEKHDSKTDRHEVLKQLQDDKCSGKIARYAAYRDYHKVLKKMLAELSAFLRTEFFPAATETDFRLSLDAHPVMERAWAHKAGLGFYGKNTCLITERAGSWVLLGAIFTTLKLPPKPKSPAKFPFAKLSCGTCTRCIRACPTGAIIAPGQIDARKCIAYLTIENKEGIPLELREKVGDRLFGCDICQEVCPFNLPRQNAAQNPLTETQIAGSTLLLQEILNLKTDSEFLNRFAGSPLMRAKRRGLIRNACVVAGNSGQRRLLPLLKKVQQREKDPMLQEHAQWAICKLELSQ